MIVCSYEEKNDFVSHSLSQAFMAWSNTLLYRVGVSGSPMAEPVATPVATGKLKL